jgi:hypothetical protein
VKSGDTLSHIAGMQGLGSWRALFSANPSIKNPDLIFPGQQLTIPSGSGEVAHRSYSAEASSAGHSQQHATTQHTSYSSRASTASVPSGSVWDRLAQCESSGNWSTNTGNGFYGGLQFTQSSWRAAGGSGSPENASRSEQIRVAQRLQQMQGWGAWPTCSAKLGLR